MAFSPKKRRFTDDEIKQEDGNQLEFESKDDETKQEDGKQLEFESKIFNDSVHGHIEISKAGLAIIDTPQFQRLRFLKQLGFGYFVYPGASHNRFEHSIGVCHLAGELVRSLSIRQPKLNIDPKDILCVELAGLCHDLGHGPHSHMFDGKFIASFPGNTDWTHEKASLDILDLIIKDNKLLKEDGILYKYGLNETDIIFIKELINGPFEEGTNVPLKKGKYRGGRGPEKSFLYEIVSNKDTGIDVDKWDYFARDCHHLGITNNFDHKRYIKFARVLYVDETMKICVRDKEIGNLYQMFFTRYNLHRRAYQHRVTCAIEAMVLDAYIKANDFITFPGKNGDKLKMSECINDITAYSKLTDDIMWQIYTSSDPDLQTAREIVTRIYKRDLYIFLKERSISEELQERLKEDKQNEDKAVRPQKTMDQLKDEMIKFSQGTLKGCQFRLEIVYMDFGKKDQDPLETMWYYSKKNPDTPIKVKQSGLLVPPRFVDILIRVYSCSSDENTCDLINESFDKLCDKWNFPSVEEEAGSRTPVKQNSFPLNPGFSASKRRGLHSQD